MVKHISDMIKFLVYREMLVIRQNCESLWKESHEILGDYKEDTNKKHKLNSYKVWFS